MLRINENGLLAFVETGVSVKDTIVNQRKLKYINMGIDLGQVMFLDDSYRGIGKSTAVFAAAENLALSPFNDVKIAVNSKAMASGLNKESGKDYYVQYEDLLENGHSEVVVFIDDLDMSAYKKLKLDCKIEIAGGVVNVEPKGNLEKIEYVLRMPMPMGSDATTWYVQSVFGNSTVTSAKYPEVTITTDLDRRAMRYYSVLDVKQAAKDTGTIACKVVTEKNQIALDL